MQRTKALAATGLLGTGFREVTFRQAIDMRPSFVGCDAGSTDPGPYYLASGDGITSPDAVRRDLELILKSAVPAGIPVVIGSAGGAGGTPHVEATVQTVKDIAAEEGLAFSLAIIGAEQSADSIIDAYRLGRLAPLPNAPEIDEDSLRATSRIVAQMGAEPLMAALEAGADVVVAGRTTDAAIFSAVPLMKGAGRGPAWHAGKILECGTAATVQRHYPDCLMADIGVRDFVISAPNPAFRCTPQSIAAHTLYENADPFLILEPGGELDTRACHYEALDGASVRVTGSAYRTREPYDVRLEGVAMKGHRFLVVGGIRDPLVLKDLDTYLSSGLEIVREKVRDSLALSTEMLRIDVRIYGRDGCLGAREPERSRLGHEVGLNIEVVAPQLSDARAAARIAWHTLLHHPVPGWSGLVSNIAFPYSPPELYVGPVYEFTLNHVLQLDDPLAPFPISLQKVG